MINVEVEVVDAKINYNLLLCRSWTHAMLCIPSILFHVLKFPQEGKIVIVDHLSFFTYFSKNNVPYMDQIPTPYESVGLGLFKELALIGIFPLTPPKIF